MGTHFRDRISSLLDEILVHMISFLKTQDAIQTGVLSKRWQFLWMKSPSICIDEVELDPMFVCRDRNVDDEVEYREELRRRFISAVDVILLSNTSPILEVFDVQFLPRGSGEAYHLNCWIRFITMSKKVKKLCIRLPCSSHLPRDQLSLHLCPCGTITSLDLSGYSIRFPPSPKSFTSIQTLVVDTRSMTHDFIKSFFTRCPSLRNCTLENLHIEGHLSFSAPWLKKLKLFKAEVLGCLEIDAPSLEGLHIMWGMEPRLQLHNMQSLTTLEMVEIPVDNDECFFCKNLAELRHVKKLTIPSLYLNAVDKWRAKNKEEMIVNQLKSVEHLIIGKFKLSQVDGLAFLLDAAPRVQKLTLDSPWPLKEYVMEHEGAEVEDYSAEIEDCLSYADSSCGSLKNLKQIQVTSATSETIHLRLIEFLLNNASTLESMEIKFYTWVVDVSSQLTFSSKLLARGGIPKIYVS